MRMTICRSSRVALALVGVALAPTFATAQDVAPRPREHVVQRGETLRELARRFLGDPAQWVAIHELNSGSLKDPHRIYPGQRIRIPSAASAAAPVPPTAIVTVPPRTASGNVTPPVPAVPAPDPRSTLFTATRPASSMGQQASQVRQMHDPAPAVRVGEYLAAPYVDREGGPRVSGRLVGSGEVPGIPLTESERLLDLQERVFVVAPEGRSAAVGDRYYTYRLGPVLPNLGQVVIPTGVIAIERVTAGQAAEGRIVAKYDNVQIGQSLLPVAPQLPPRTSRASAIANGPEMRIAWVDGGSVLPTLQRYVVLDRGSAGGIRIGDQVTLFRGRRQTPEGITLPESEIAVAQVVRTSGSASTAMIIAQSQPEIGEGTQARVSAKMP